MLWPEKKQNVITMPTLAPNRQAVFDALEIWAPCIDEPKSPPVSWLKSEVWYCQTKSWYLKYSKRSDSKSNQQGIYMTKWHFPLEAKALYEFMGDVDDREAAVNSDAWGVKRFLTLLIRRWKTQEKVAKEKGTTPNFRIPWQQREIIYNVRCLFRSPSLLNFISHRNHSSFILLPSLSLGNLLAPRETDLADHIDWDEPCWSHWLRWALLITLTEMSLADHIDWDEPPKPIL